MPACPRASMCERACMCAPEREPAAVTMRDLPGPLLGEPPPQLFSSFFFRDVGAAALGSLRRRKNVIAAGNILRTDLAAVPHRLASVPCVNFSCGLPTRPSSTLSAKRTVRPETIASRLGALLDRNRQHSRPAWRRPAARRRLTRLAGAGAPAVLRDRGTALLPCPAARARLGWLAGGSSARRRACCTHRRDDLRTTLNLGVGAAALHVSAVRSGWQAGRAGCRAAGAPRAPARRRRSDRASHEQTAPPCGSLLPNRHRERVCRPVARHGRCACSARRRARRGGARPTAIGSVERPRPAARLAASHSSLSVARGRGPVGVDVGAR